MAEFSSLKWYVTDEWSYRLDMDITGVKAEVVERIGYLP